MTLEKRSLATLARDLRDGRVRARDLCDAAIANHESIGADLNAYREWAPQRARAQAEAADAAFKAGRDLGPLQGLPQSVKDNYGVPGFAVYAGTPQALPEAFAAAGPIVAKILGQSGVVTGKTHMVEFALGTLGTNPHWGAPVNPWDRADHRGPGGSSSGAGVTLCEGSALLAWGSDTAGSIRCPASMTGVVGYKATNGRWPAAGVVPLSSTMDVPGPLTRSAEDLAFVWAVVEDRDLADLAPVAAGDLTVGVADDFFWTDCSPGVAEAVRKAIAELEAAGATLVDTAIPDAAEAFAITQKGGLAAYEFSRFVTDELPDWEEAASPPVAQRIAAGRALSVADYEARLKLVMGWQQAAAACFAACDVIVAPTTPLTPPKLADVAKPDAFRHHSMLNLRNTTVGNLLSLPAATLPVGLDKAGLPVGLQVMAKPGDDERLIRILRGIEAVIGTPALRIGVPK